jgi:phosphate-selective porin OprO/OprP
MRGYLLSTTVLVSGLLLPSATFAASSVDQRLDQLEKALAAQQRIIDAQQAEIQSLRAQVGSRQAAPAQADLAATVEAQKQDIAQLKEQAQKQKLQAADQPKLGFSLGRPTISSPDGRFTFSPRLVVQADFATYDQAAAGPLATDYRRGSVGGGRENNAARDLSDGAYFRRARFGFEGTFNRDFGYRLVGEFGGAGTELQGRINDAYVNYTGFAPFTIQVGAYSPPANMDDGTGVEDTLMLERATPAELSRSLAGADGRLSAGVRFATQRWMGALTFTGRAVTDAEVFDSQAAVVGRFAHLLATGSDYNVHVGVNGSYVFSAADQGADAAGARSPLRFRDRPELRVDSTRLIDTGSIDASGAYAAGVEFGANYRNFYLQAEHFWYGIERRQPTALPNPNFTGWYVQGSWNITGESRRYSMASGSFAAPRPLSPFSASGGWGAWELAVRYSQTDLNDDAGVLGSAPPVGGVRGGEQKILAVGLNWFMTPNLRMSFNYLHVDVDRLNPAGPGNTAPFGAPPATPPVGVEIGQSYDAFALRTQFGF